MDVSVPHALAGHCAPGAREDAGALGIQRVQDLMVLVFLDLKRPQKSRLATRFQHF